MTAANVLNSGTLEDIMPLLPQMHARAQRARARNMGHMQPSAHLKWQVWAQAGNKTNGACICHSSGLEGWHELSISKFPADSCRSHLPHLPASGRHLAFQAVRICHLVHLVHLIYAIQAHLDLGRASRPSQPPSCHLKMEI